MSSTRRRRRRARRTTTIAIVPVLAALVLAPACGGPAVAERDGAAPIELPGDPAAGTAPTTRSGPPPPTTAGGVAGALVQPPTVDRTVWFEGFKINLGRAAVDTAAKTLTIDGDAENEGPADGSLYEDVRLEQQDVAIASGTIRTQASVLAGSRNAVRVDIRQLPATFNPDKAVLVIGDGKHQHVRVPLKVKDGTASGEPLVVTPAPPEIVAGGLHVGIAKLSVRGDDPKGHSQAPIESQYVVVEGSVRFDAATTNFMTQNMALVPPNGPPQSPKYLNALPRNGASEKIFIVFEMPTPIGGVYTLQVKGDFAYSDRRFSPDTPATAEIRITLPTYPPRP